MLSNCAADAEVEVEVAPASAEPEPPVRPVQRSPAGRCPPEVLEPILDAALDSMLFGQPGVAKRRFESVAVSWLEAMRLLSGKRVIVVGLSSARQLYAECLRRPERATRIVSLHMILGDGANGASSSDWLDAFEDIVTMAGPSLRTVYFEGGSGDRFADIAQSLRAAGHLRRLETNLRQDTNPRWVLDALRAHRSLRTLRAADITYEWNEPSRSLSAVVLSENLLRGFLAWPETSQVLGMYGWVRDFKIVFSPSDDCPRHVFAILFPLLMRPGALTLRISTADRSGRAARIPLQPDDFKLLRRGVGDAHARWRTLDMRACNFVMRDGRPWTRSDYNEARGACAGQLVYVMFRIDDECALSLVSPR